VSAQVIPVRTPELVAYGRVMRAHTVLRRALETEVLQPRGLTINDFEALMHLAEAEEGRLRRIDLAGRLMLSPSGVTRLLEGLQAGGLVMNLQCDDDARVTWARLTEEGVRTLECVGAEHSKVVRSLFGDALGEDEVARLSELLGRLPGVGDGSCAG
jgi:DNA-binding MarR family transcriptional regulator